MHNNLKPCTEICISYNINKLKVKTFSKSLQTSNINEKRNKTYFNLRNLMQDAKFSFEENKITATFGNNLKENKKLFKNSINYTTSKYSINGKINNIDEVDNVTHKYDMCDKYIP